VPDPLPPLPACPQTFLVPYDPEDHEDVDEWRPWLGQLSAKELHKVGAGGWLVVGGEVGWLVAW
jgi:hypothetical protein